MKSFLHFFTISVFSCLFLTCKTGVETDNLDPQNLYAVTSFISPQDSIIKVYLFRGRPLGVMLRADSALVTNAIVQIKSIDGNIDFSFNFDEYRYEALNLGKNKIKAGQEYNLSIKTKDGVLINGKCLVPAFAPKIGKITGAFINNDYEFSVSMSTEKNSQYVYYQQDMKFSRKLTIGVDRPYLQFSDRDFVFPKEILPSSDLVTNGIIRNAKGTEYCNLIVTVSNLESSMFRYLKSYNNYNNWAINTGGLLPNFNEPQPIYSNLTGGIGIFAGFNQVEYMQKVK